MHFTRLPQRISPFASDTPPYLLAFNLLDSIVDIIDMRFPLASVISPAEAVLTAESFKNR